MGSLVSYVDWGKEAYGRMGFTSAYLAAERTIHDRPVDAALRKQALGHMLRPRSLALDLETSLEIENGKGSLEGIARDHGYFGPGKIEDFFARLYDEDDFMKYFENYIYFDIRRLSHLVYLPEKFGEDITGAVAIQTRYAPLENVVLFREPHDDAYLQWDVFGNLPMDANIWRFTLKDAKPGKGDNAGAGTAMGDIVGYCYSVERADSHRFLDAGEMKVLANDLAEIERSWCEGILSEDSDRSMNHPD